MSDCLGTWQVRGHKSENPEFPLVSKENSDILRMIELRKSRSVLMAANQRSGLGEACTELNQNMAQKGLKKCSFCRNSALIRVMEGRAVCLVGEI